MKLKKSKISDLLDQIQAIKKRAERYEKKYASFLVKVHPEYQKSARNLLHYIALRKEDLKEVQEALWQMGISRLGKAESHIMASLISVETLLKGILTEKLPVKSNKPELSFKKGKKCLKKHTNALLGKKLKGSNARIMVTLPTESAENPALIKNLFAAGMNSARINCAHDDTVVWGRMIEHIDKARKQTGRTCKVCMDLGGPKLRTGAVRQGPKVVHLTPQRDLTGRVTVPAEAWLVSVESTDMVSLQESLRDEEILIPLPLDFLDQIRPNDEIHLIDARGKQKRLIAGRKLNGKRIVRCFESAYIESGTPFILKVNREITIPEAPVGELLPLEESILLRTGDTLIIHKDDRPGEPAAFDESGAMIHPAHISCTLPEVFMDVKPGELILMDDGKIEGAIQSVTEDTITVEITYAKEEGTKLKADKGINLPESTLSIRGLTEKDKEDLVFIARHADVVNYSFVNTPDDVTMLFGELAALEAKEIGIILKIETHTAFENLPAILLTAMQHYPIGVMIARGDLAIECGWKELAWIQEEIMRVCEAAHIPIVWATQVLETMAKKGRPSRAEISDAALAGQAESVMLNKGPFIFDAIRILDEIISSMQVYRDKQTPLMPAMRFIAPEAE